VQSSACPPGNVTKRNGRNVASVKDNKQLDAEEAQHLGEHPLSPPADEFDVIVVGAGWAGLYAIYELRRRGHSVYGFEAGAGVGGAWYHNRYPGARCDVESLEYSFSFDEGLQQEWHWTETYARQPEIRAYMNHVANRFELRRSIQLNTFVKSAVWDEEADRWTVTASTGDVVRARYVLLGVGGLSTILKPQIPGYDSFAGQIYFTANWPSEPVDFTGKRVGVIGTGSSGVQSIPVIAETAKHLTVFQRTPNYVMPSASAPMDPDYEAEWKAHYAEKRAFARHQSSNGINQPVIQRKTMDTPPEERERIYQELWDRGGLWILRSFSDILTDPEANKQAGAFVERKIADIVKDPKTAQLLTPKGYYFATKRLCTGTGYYETFNRDNVSLVDVGRDTGGIHRIEPGGIVTDEGLTELDIIVFATGFDAVTGSFTAIDIHGVGGRTLKDHWKDGAKTYLGMFAAGFPNLFLIGAPGNPGSVGNAVVALEMNIEWIAQLLDKVRAEGARRLEAEPAAEESWSEHVSELGWKTLYPTNPNSWYVGANVPGKKRQFLPYVGGFSRYDKEISEVAARGYEGISID